MLAQTPQEAVTAADDAFNSRDLEGVLAFYEDGAIGFLDHILSPTTYRDALTENSRDDLFKSGGLFPSKRADRWNYSDRCRRLRLYPMRTRNTAWR